MIASVALIIIGPEDSFLKGLGSSLCVLSILLLSIGMVVGIGTASQAAAAGFDSVVIENLSTVNPSATFSSEGISLTLEKSNWAVGEEIALRFTAPAWPKSQQAWVGIVPAATPPGKESINDAAAVSYLHLGGHASGQLRFPSPGEGAWSIRMHDFDDPSLGKQVAQVEMTVGEVSVVSALQKAFDEKKEELPDVHGFEEKLDESIAAADIEELLNESLAGLDDQISSGELDVESLQALAEPRLMKTMSGLPAPVQEKGRSMLYSRIEELAAKAEVKKAAIAAAATGGLAGVGLAAASVARAADKVQTVVEEVEEVIEPEDEPEVEEVIEAEDEPVVEEVIEPEEEPVIESESEPEPESEPEIVAEPADTVEPAMSLHDLVHAFSEARFASERSKLIEANAGAAYSFSVEVSRVERTLGIGLTEHLRNGRSVAGKVVGDDIEVIVRMPASRNDEIDAMKGGELAVSGLVSDWNSLRKRLDLDHVE